MAVNLIRAHREELIQASTGKLDHMVIDVVGSLFDQILSDTRVPTQMAREIARLQLPVLRVALVDSTFFSSRRHPVRRFINRIAALACAFDDFDDGPGKEFVERVRDLVQEIVEGDFDQVDLYAAKLGDLESFITQQATSEVKDRGAIAVLETKETDLRTQQRYLIQLQGALSSISMPDFLRSFLCQVWSQALVQAARKQGDDGEPTKRYRNVGRDLVMSVQPKGSPGMRKRFLMQLPTLMRDLNEGLKLIGWPEGAQKEFFGQLLPAHAESLKLPAMTELDYNMVSELYYMREVLEGTAARLAAQHASEVELTIVDEICDQYGRSLDDGAALSVKNRQFHEALYRCAHNRYLLKTLTLLHDALALLGESMLHDRARAERTLAEHAAIVQAIKDRDPDRAERATRDHIRLAQTERLKRQFAGI